jgi:hypothetical protein
MLYMQADGRREIGNGEHGVTAMVRHYDRTLIMTAAGTWTTDMQSLSTPDETDTFRAVNSTLGCSTVGGASSIGNNPISICGGDILRWNADTDELDECNAQSMAGEIRSLLPSELAQKGRVYYDGKHNEARFYLPGGEGSVFVWQYGSKNWTTMDFGKVPLQGFFAYHDRTGVLLGNTLYLSCDDMGYDTDADGTIRPIACRYTSHVLDFEHGGESIRPYAVLLCAAADAGQAFEVRICTPAGKWTGVVLTATGEQPCEMQRRIATGRCRHATLQVRCDCLGECRLRMVAIAVGR